MEELGTIIICLILIAGACATSVLIDQTHEQRMAEIKFKRDKAHQELLVEMVREKRLLKEARIRELEVTGSFITKEGIVCDQQIDKVN